MPSETAKVMLHDLCGHKQSDGEMRKTWALLKTMVGEAEWYRSDYFRDSFAPSYRAKWTNTDREKDDAC
jgi:hypothetical protein